MASISILLSWFFFSVSKKKQQQKYCCWFDLVATAAGVKTAAAFTAATAAFSLSVQFSNRVSSLFRHACVSMLSIFTSDYFAVFLTSQNVFSYQSVKFAKKKPKKRVALRLNRWRVSRVGFVQKFLITKTYRWSGTTSMSAGTRFVYLGYIKSLSLSLARSIIIVVWLTN